MTQTFIHYSLFQSLYKYNICTYTLRQSQQIVTNIYGTEKHKIKTRNHSIHAVPKSTQQKNQENAITKYGPRLFNSLPKYGRHMQKMG